MDSDRAVHSPLRRVASFLFFSGACALVYQIAWFRELRLIFGGSTAASSAVMAVFMGGLGVGGLVLGKRADRAKNAFALYATLELLIAISAAVSPLLVMLAQAAYVGIGGSSTLGSGGATVVRLLLTVIVLGPPTFAMGGTMPAAARAVERARDVSRNSVAVLYGVNTIGAVMGTVAANFVLIEIFGTRTTLWMACLVNALVAVTARASARRFAGSDAHDDEISDASEAPPAPHAPRWFPPLAAASAGFAFMLAELVWYRMLAPLLGGTSYTFGLILAVALAGIGIGGALYSFGGSRRPTLGHFALTCALEALAIGIPFALGDRIALFALYLGPLAHASFSGALVAWSLISVIVVFPAAVVSGYQFPVLIALYGEGRKNVGADVGRTYVANTAGSITGSLAGGFGLLPGLSAPGCWKLVILLLAATAALALVLDARLRRREALRTIAVGGTIAILAIVCLSARGPTSTWRHSGIGANRASAADLSKEGLAEFEQHYNSTVKWSVDGLESSVALDQGRGYAFIVNGKSDGHVIGDRATQVMSGLLGALVQGNTKNTLIVGLGTGSTAGWLAAVPSVERVDVVELEPAILRVARDCKDVNQDVLANPKVHIKLGDAREALLTSRASYDLVFSEPSNPYRAGISSLYTLEYYQAVTRRLSDDGALVQWIQSYDVDPFTVGTAIVTLRQVFPSLTLWQTEHGDLLLVGQKHTRPLDLDRMRLQLQEEPFSSAAQVAWGTDSVEGILAHFIGAPAFSDAVVANQLGIVNRDDENALEFAFARHVGTHERVDTDIARLARRLHLERPLVTGAFDEERVEEERLLTAASLNAVEILSVTPPKVQKAFATAVRSFVSGNYLAGLKAWTELDRPPRSYYETILVATAMALTGDPRLPSILPLMKRPNERLFAEGVWLVKTGKVDEGVDALARGFISARTDPWIASLLLLHGRGAALEAGSTPARAKTLSAALAEPFAAEVVRSERISAHVQLALRTGDTKECVAAFERAEPIPFDRTLIEARVACYAAARDPRLPVAEAALQRLHSFRPVFGAAVPSPPPAGESDAGSR